MTFKENHIVDFQSIFDTSKEKIRAYPGVKHLELLQSKIDRRIFFTYSVWENEESLEHYRKSELFLNTWAKYYFTKADKNYVRIRESHECLLKSLQFPRERSSWKLLNISLACSLYNTYHMYPKWLVVVVFLQKNGNNLNLYINTYLCCIKITT